MISAEYGQLGNIELVLQPLQRHCTSPPAVYSDLISALDVAIRHPRADVIKMILGGIVAQRLSPYRRCLGLRKTLLATVRKGYQMSYHLVCASLLHDCQLDNQQKYEILRQAILCCAVGDPHGIFNMLPRSIGTLQISLKQKVELYYQVFKRLNHEQTLSPFVLMSGRFTSLWTDFKSTVYELENSTENPAYSAEDIQITLGPSLSDILNLFQRKYLGPEQHLLRLLDGSYNGQHLRISSLIEGFLSHEHDLRKQCDGLGQAIKAYAADRHSHTLLEITKAYLRLCKDSHHQRQSFSTAREACSDHSAENNFLLKALISLGLADRWSRVRHDETGRSKTVYSESIFWQSNLNFIESFCYICHRDLHEKEYVTRLPCGPVGHGACAICMYKWLEQDPRCPHCRQGWSLQKLFIRFRAPLTVLLAAYSKTAPSEAH